MNNKRKMKKKTKKTKIVKKGPWRTVWIVE
jgi:hypothetical protein